MGIIFGKRKPVSRITVQDKAILQLKQQRDRIKQYQKRIQLTLTSDRELAKKLLENGQRERAKLLLRKKRFQEQLLIKTDGQLINIEALAHDIEFAQVELQVVEGLKQGSEALKKVNDSLNIADIERILDETREGIDKQEEINSLLSGKLTEEDEEAVENELAGLISEELPNIPSEELVLGDKEAEEESPKEKAKTKKQATKEPVALEA